MLLHQNIANKRLIMKNFIFLLFISSNLLIAESNFEDAYIQFSGLKKEELTKDLTNSDYSKGLSFLNNKA